MEKSKCMLNPMDQASHEELHFSNYQSLLNQDMEWLEDQKWKLIIWIEASQVTSSRNDVKVKAHVATLMKMKRRKVATLIIMQALVEEMYFCLILNLGMPLYQEGYYIDC
jgi:hypothetical protein